MHNWGAERLRKLFLLLTLPGQRGTFGAWYHTVRAIIRSLWDSNGRVDISLWSYIFVLNRGAIVRGVVWGAIMICV